MLLKLNNETFPGSGEKWVVQKTIKEVDNGVSP